MKSFHSICNPNQCLLMTSLPKNKAKSSKSETPTAMRHPSCCHFMSLKPSPLRFLVLPPPYVWAILPSYDIRPFLLTHPQQFVLSKLFPLKSPDQIDLNLQADLCPGRAPLPTLPPHLNPSGQVLELLLSLLRAHRTLPSS